MTHRRGDITRLILVVAMVVWGGQTQAGNTTAAAVTEYNACLQDDTNSAVTLSFNSTTGDYLFCCGGTSFRGKGAVSTRGGIVTLEHSTTDRRLVARLELNTKTGTASFQAPPGAARCTLSDRNTSNSRCACD
jgi:hypothetical protein